MQHDKASSSHGKGFNETKSQLVTETEAPWLSQSYLRLQRNEEPAIIKASLISVQVCRLEQKHLSLMSLTHRLINEKDKTRQLPDNLLKGQKEQLLLLF